MVGGPVAALDGWRLIRRYAVPGWMIAECTEARERGDWRTACEAARVTVAFSDPDVAGEVADLLAGFAPDLLRWHLPRALDGSAALATGLRLVLAPEGPVTADTTVLGVRTPRRWVGSSQRLTLHAVRAGDIAEGPVFPLPPWLWDARRAAELPAATEPEPRHRAPEGQGILEPWTAAGWSLDPADIRDWRQSELGLVRGVAPGLAAHELRRLVAQFGRGSWELRFGYYIVRPDEHLRLELDGTQPRLARRAATPSQPGPTRADLCLHPAFLRSPVDLQLVRHGRIGVEELHPLVRAALFPSAPTGQPADAGLVPAGFAEGERIRVRCGPDWHAIGLRGGRLDLLHHTDDERRRERALRAIGGTANGCFAVDLAWHDGTGALPRRLHTYRRDLWRRMQHGGSRVVLALLDAGLDPQLRDERGRTLLHRLHQFESAEVLPRLLAEGLDVNAHDWHGLTPMCEAVAHTAPPALLRALNEAGALPPLSEPSAGPETWSDPWIGSEPPDESPDAHVCS
ncbi:ankyrin repeat domain-containing protein [Dactylosporangium siamense]|uniref:Ankyrin repeat domain-containing protein n=1 Tax=Dactylosporangium siamense TaxID=685454 RepID=A0A919UAM3_9ACTN|nr:hypothetical protein [Dactylosporangium siamense]GIG44636.1 hypothetical protein Dsi01nite_026770 [Dactylosporangium siamense]